MAITEAFVQTGVTVGATELSLPNNSTSLTPRTDQGVFQPYIDVNNIAAGDQYQVRVYEKVASGSTQRLVSEWILDGAQAQPIFTTPALILLNGWDITLKKLAGTDRTFDWSIRKIA